ncbi:hypothetical protein [Aureimonas psammosilenae]|uniref:hypothetical protein n=1 Tax=Aureimonas psammosilenae TaxID=2495496 RepID=UPI001260E656|nr:hypothetical protein [Aureimonas psammosilenae]
MSTLSTDVEIKLDGETFYLRSTLKAAQNISRQYGGFVGTFQALQVLSLEVAQYIVKQGITAKNISTDDLNDKVWRAGVGNLTKPLARYVSILQNGGRDPDLNDGDDTQDSDEGNG